jgi:hypothetical protein
VPHGSDLHRFAGLHWAPPSINYDNMSQRLLTVMHSTVIDKLLQQYDLCYIKEESHFFKSAIQYLGSLRMNELKRTLGFRDEQCYCMLEIILGHVFWTNSLKRKREPGTP